MRRGEGNKGVPRFAAPRAQRSAQVGAGARNFGGGCAPAPLRCASMCPRPLPQHRFALCSLLQYGVKVARAPYLTAKPQ